MQIMVNGLLTYYESFGSGPVVLILHGWGDSSRSWQKVQGKLAEEYHVIVPDLPGFGFTETQKEVWGLDDYVYFVQKFLQKLDIEQPYAIIGHSNGGAIAIKGIGSGKLAPEKLILIASAGIRNDNSVRKTLLRYIAKSGKVLTALLPGRIKNNLRRKMYIIAGSDMLVAEHLQETFKRTVTDDVQSEAKQIPTKTLLIYGDVDDSTPILYGKKFQQLIHGSKLKIIPGAGHFIHQDKYKEVILEMRKFLR